MLILIIYLPISITEFKVIKFIYASIVSVILLPAVQLFQVTDEMLVRWGCLSEFCQSIVAPGNAPVIAMTI